MKIALINPPFRGVVHNIASSYPIGLGYIKAVCKMNGIEVDLYDFSATNLTDEELVNKYKLREYKVVGISSYSLMFEDTVNLIRCLKTGDNITIVGGHHISLLKERVLDDFECVDYGIIGFGEYSFLKFVQNYTAGNNLYDIPGLCYRRDDNLIICNSQDYSMFNLDDLPLPDRKDITWEYNFNELIDLSKKTLSLSTSRGCPYRCTYCVNCNNSYWIYRSVDNLLKEVEYEFANNNYKNINFIDCNFFVNPERAKIIIERIHNLYPYVTFSFQTRSDQVVNNKYTINQILTLCKCSIILGIESNSNIVLNRYKKDTNDKINQQAIDIIKKYYDEIIIYIIMFEALEEISDIRKTFDFLKNNKLYIHARAYNLYQTLIPFYGTNYYNDYNMYYTKNIHGRTTPIFINKDVESLYNVTYRLFAVK